MQTSILLIPEKLVLDEDQCFQLIESERKLEEPSPWKEVGHIDWIGNEPIVDIEHSIMPLSIANF